MVLLASDVDAADFFFPNGAFNGKRFELLSYITGERADADAGPYLRPATELPSSHTEGIGALDAQGNIFGNLPPLQKGYIHRKELERELHTVVTDDHHSIVTLLGRGGIGKTSLALSVLHQVSNEDRFQAILWFSARDIDLLPEGPKQVKPHVLTEKDVAQEFAKLMGPSGWQDKSFDAVKYLADAMLKSPLGRPLLFVFDNFETVRSPAELFAWIDHYIRPPNKVLITTRTRDFRADFPVEVTGMTQAESEELINVTAENQGILDILTDDYRQQLWQESDGHPYVIKMLLGEAAKAQKLVKIERIVASKDELLEALFERTFSALSLAARRVFLTLCNWRSAVPQVAVEAVLLRPANERMDVERAIEELRQSSFLEQTESEQDREVFLTVPLVTSIFGRRKLEVNPMKSAVEADTRLLQTLGAAQEVDIRHGLAPRLERMVRQIADRVSRGQGQLDDYLPMLEFIARKYAPAWLLIARLHEEMGAEDALEQAKDAVRRYLEVAPTPGARQQAWERLATLCRRTQDAPGEAHALVEMGQLPLAPFVLISETANRLNQLFKDGYRPDVDEKEIVVRHLIEVMENRIQEGDATDCSRLAWLCLHVRDYTRARRFTQLGLEKDPANAYCRRLARELSLEYT